jgi:formylglycine-generating enzyme required for sulfatase activity
MMGSNDGISGFSDDRPVHEVEIREGFYLGRYEITQAEWHKVMATDPSFSKGERLPVENVSWNDAQNFIRKLNDRADGFSYRLPTEAEWEYACRAGTTGDYAGPLEAMGWHKENSNNRTHPVGMKQPNAFGLFDMHGNVEEWCEDWYHKDYDGAPRDGSAWLSGGKQEYRVYRGGSWTFYSHYLRSATRSNNWPDTRNNFCGFRIVAIRRTQ